MPDTTVYDARLDSIFSATAALDPWCLVLPESTSEVSKVMEVIDKEHCAFGIRSGGHAVYANGNSVHDGITIDLGYMNSTTYDAETNIASIQPGTRWGPVYSTLAKDGVAVVGGRVTSVGVAGLVLGGGNSFHSGRHGFACDTVEAYEVVLANGTVVTATEDAHADLFRSLCGGSGNMGIVTRFDMRAVKLPHGKESPNIWGGTAMWEYDNMQLVDELVKFTDNAEDDLGCSAFCAWIWAKADPVKQWRSACALQNVDDKANATLFKGIMDTNGTLGNSFRSAPIATFTTEVGRLAQEGKQNIWGSSTFKNDPRVIRFAIEAHKKLATRLSVLFADDPSASALLIFQPLTLPLMSHGAGKNMLGLEADAARDGAGMFTLFMMQCGSRAEAELARPLVRAFERSIDEYAKKVGSHWAWTYLNYVDFSRDPISTYGAKNVKFLQKVAKAYDPKHIFQKLRRSGHKLPKTC